MRKNLQKNNKIPEIYHDLRYLNSKDFSDLKNFIPTSQYAHKAIKYRHLYFILKYGK